VIASRPRVDPYKPACDEIASEGDSYGNVTHVNCRQMFRPLLANDINCIRITTTDAAIRDNPPIAHVCGSLNPGLVDLRYCQALKTIVAFGATVGMKFIIESHLNENASNKVGQQGNGLWYDVGGASNGVDGGPPIHTGTVPDANFLEIWKTRINLFESYDKVVGYDLRNESLLAVRQKPECTWAGYNGGTIGSDRDIRDMYQHVGNAILAIDPTLLNIWLPRCPGWVETSSPCLSILRFLRGSVSQFG
jgi:hypothetical protein